MNHYACTKIPSKELSFSCEVLHSGLILILKGFLLLSKFICKCHVYNKYETYYNVKLDFIEEEVFGIVIDH